MSRTSARDARIAFSGSRTATRLGALWFTAACLSACAGPSAPEVQRTDSDAAGEAASAFVRSVYPFEVVDAEGRPYDHPFLGGFNVPRPQFVDIDDDGDNDLFVQEVTGSVMLFERTGDEPTPTYRWVTDRFRGLDVGEWYRFVDMDGDDDLDLLTEQRFSHIAYYRRTAGGRFEVVTDSLRDVDGEPIFSDRQNIPNVTDLDCDGRPDLFLGRLDGTISRFESGGVDDRGAPLFRLIANRFEDIEIVGELQLGARVRPDFRNMTARHGANTLAFADVDGDGDQDLLWGDFFEPGLLLITNTGSCTSPDLHAEPAPFPRNDPLETSGYNAPAIVDHDGDGDLDVFVGVLGGAFNANRTTVENLFHLEQREDGFHTRTRRFLYTIDGGSDAVPALADVDADGDLDLFVGTKIEPTHLRTGRLMFFENIGSAAAPRFAERDTLALLPGYHYGPELADLDADGDLDLIVGNWSSDVFYYRNDGTPSAPNWVLADSALVTLTRGSNTKPAAADMDGDGDLDLMVGESSGTLNLYRNVGTSVAPRFELVSDRYGDLDVGRRSAPTFVDADGDGDPDLFVGSGVDGYKLYLNESSESEIRFVAAPAGIAAAPDLAAPAFGDLDGDGDEDLVVGSASGGLIYLERTGSWR